MDAILGQFQAKMLDAIIEVQFSLEMSEKRNFWRFFFSKKLVIQEMTQFLRETQFLMVQ